MLVGITPEGSDHNAVDSVKFDPERDLEFSFKFKFANSQAKSFNVWFDGRDYKRSHAGHICNVTVNQKSVMVGDAKTGSFRNDLYERKKAQPSALTDEDKKLLAAKNITFPTNLSIGVWSDGVGHDHKTLVSLTTQKLDVHYADFCIKGVG